MSGKSSNMYWTVRSQYCVTTTIIPPSLPTPPSPPTELCAATQPGRDVTPKWAHRDPRLKAHYKYEHPMSVQRPSEYSSHGSYGYFTASPSDSSGSCSGNTLKRHSEKHRGIPTVVPLKKHKVFPKNEVHEQKPVVGNYDLSALGTTGTTNVTDLLAKLVSAGLISDAKKESSIKTGNKCEKGQKSQDSDSVNEVDLLIPASLRTAQPGLISRMYGGMQCSNCSSRFPSTESKQYSEHLDWHFRQNRRARVARRRGQSRPWYYGKSDWLQSEEIEEPDRKKDNWFESMAKRNLGTAQSKSVPSVVMGKLADDECEICGDKFETFFNDDDDEWHLKNAVRGDQGNYHPTCLKHQKTKTELKFEAVGGNYEMIDEKGDGNNMDDNDVVCIAPPIEIIVVPDEEDQETSETAWKIKS